jgi:transposase, IS5 family
VPAVGRVARVTGRVPATVAGDRGFCTAANDRELAELGVARIGLQAKGALSAARAARLVIEARISYLKRGFGLRRTRLRRLVDATIWVGLGIFAYNLQRMTMVAAR